MRRYGIIGYPLSHSLSQKYFTEKFKNENIKDCIYDIFPIERIELLPSILNEHVDLIGLNVTIPFKEKVIPYLNSFEVEITEIGAVNTIKIFRNGNSIHLKGFNTDVYGFSESLKPYINNDYKNAMILGTGGASKAVAYALKKMGFKFFFVSRTPKDEGIISYKEITKQCINNVQLIVNTSPVGMYPDNEMYPLIPYNYLTSNHILYDLIYNPVETKFMTKGKEMGSKVINGMQMLKLQADKAWEIWNKS